MTTTIDFSEKNTYCYNIADNITLHMRNINSSNVLLYFTDNNVVIDIPKGINVYQTQKYNYNSFNSGEKRILQNPNHSREYILWWCENYSIEYNDRKILYMENKKYWNIMVLEDS